MGKNLSPFRREEERKMLTRWVIYREETSRFEGKEREKKKGKKDKHKEGQASILSPTEPNWLEASFVPRVVRSQAEGGGGEEEEEEVWTTRFSAWSTRDTGEGGWKGRMESKRPVLFRSAISRIGIFEGISIFPRSFEISWKLLRLTDSGGFSRNANGPPSSQSFAPPVRAPPVYFNPERNFFRRPPILFS